jgi:ribonuclease VapC
MVVDSSVVLAHLFNEPGANAAFDILDSATISSVNVSEVIAKLVSKGWDELQAADRFKRYGLTIVNHDEPMAIAAGSLLARHRKSNVSLGDAACLALAMVRNEPVATADRQWTSLGLDLEVELIR